MLNRLNLKVSLLELLMVVAFIALVAATAWAALELAQLTRHFSVRVALAGCGFLTNILSGHYLIKIWRHVGKADSLITMLTAGRTGLIRAAAVVLLLTLQATAALFSPSGVMETSGWLNQQAANGRAVLWRAPAGEDTGPDPAAVLFHPPTHELEVLDSRLRRVRLVRGATHEVRTLIGHYRADKPNASLVVAALVDHVLGPAAGPKLAVALHHSTLPITMIEVRDLLTDKVEGGPFYYLGCVSSLAFDGQHLLIVGHDMMIAALEPALHAVETSMRSTPLSVNRRTDTIVAVDPAGSGVVGPAPAINVRDAHAEWILARQPVPAFELAGDGVRVVTQSIRLADRNDPPGAHYMVRVSCTSNVGSGGVLTPRTVEVPISQTGVQLATRTATSAQTPVTFIPIDADCLREVAREVSDALISPSTTTQIIEQIVDRRGDAAGRAQECAAYLLSNARSLNNAIYSRLMSLAVRPAVCRQLGHAMAALLTNPRRYPPSDMAAYHHTAGLLFFRAGDYEKAKEHLVASVTPFNRAPHGTYALLAEIARRQQRAEEHAFWEEHRRGTISPRTGHPEEDDLPPMFRSTALPAPAAAPKQN